MHTTCEEWHGKVLPPCAISLFSWVGLFCLLMGFDDFKFFFPLSYIFLIWPGRFALFVCRRLPVKTLQLEQTAVVGQAEEPSVVASRMLLVFSTLEVSLAQC